MLTVKQRKTYLKNLGYFKGKIDSKEDDELKKAYKDLQDDYFVRKKDRDGKYGPNTEKLLLNAYYVKKYTKNFDLKSDKLFKCGCGGKYCTGYPGVLDIQLLKNIQRVRDKFGPTTITSGMRCRLYNNSLVGSSSTSRHMPNVTGRCRALDFANAKTNTEAGRKTVMAYWKSLPKYNYTYCNLGGNHPNMGNAVHGDVK